MIYLPLAAVFLGLAWMIWRGFKDKAEYLRPKNEGRL